MAQPDNKSEFFSVQRKRPSRGDVRFRRNEGGTPTLRQGGITTSSSNFSPISNSGIRSRLGQRLIDLSGSGLSVAGSIAPTTSEGFGWTFSDTNIHIFFDGTNGSKQQVVRLSDSTQVGLAQGDINVTGLVASTAYYFLPFFAVNNPCKTVSWVIGTAGSPQIAFTAAALTSAALQAQQLANRIPLASVIKITTAAPAGSGSGTGGGSVDPTNPTRPGCPRIGQLVVERSRGRIPVQHVKVGDWLEGPSGWGLVVGAEIVAEEDWALLTTEDGEELEISTTTPQPMRDGTSLMPAELRRGDALAVRKGLRPWLRQVELYREPGQKVIIALDTKEHTFYCGWGAPSIVTHNVNVKDQS